MMQQKCGFLRHLQTGGSNSLRYCNCAITSKSRGLDSFKFPVIFAFDCATYPVTASNKQLVTSNLIILSAPMGCLLLNAMNLH